MFLAVLQPAWQSGRHGAMQEQPELSSIVQESLAVDAKQHGMEIKSTWSASQTINNINGTLIDYHTYNQTSVNLFLDHPVTSKVVSTPSGQERNLGFLGENSHPFSLPHCLYSTLLHINTLQKPLSYSTHSAPMRNPDIQMQIYGTGQFHLLRANSVCYTLKTAKQGWLSGN